MRPQIQSEFPAVSGTPIVGVRKAAFALGGRPFGELLRRVTVAHAVALALLVVLPLLYSLIFRSKPPEEIALITLQGSGSPDAPLRDPAPQQQPDPPQPDPPQPDPPQPTPPKPPDPKADIPDKVLTPTNALANTKPAVTNKPKIKIGPLVDLSPIKKPDAPRVSAADEFKKMVGKGMPSGGSTSSGPGYGRGTGGSGGMGGTGSGFGSLLDMYCRSAWDRHKPLEAPAGNPAAEVWFTARRDGTVTESGVSRRSGNRVFDAAVESAVRDISKLPALPSDIYPSTPARVTVTFDFRALR